MRGPPVSDTGEREEGRRLAGPPVSDTGEQEAAAARGGRTDGPDRPQADRTDDGGGNPGLGSASKPIGRPELAAAVRARRVAGDSIRRRRRRESGGSGRRQRPKTTASAGDGDARGNGEGEERRCLTEGGRRGGRRWRAAAASHGRRRRPADELRRALRKEERGIREREVDPGGRIPWPKAAVGMALTRARGEGGPATNLDGGGAGEVDLGRAKLTAATAQDGGESSGG